MVKSAYCSDLKLTSSEGAALVSFSVTFSASEIWKKNEFDRLLIVGKSTNVWQLQLPNNKTTIVFTNLTHKAIKLIFRKILFDRLLFHKKSTNVWQKYTVKSFNIIHFHEINIFNATSNWNPWKVLFDRCFFVGKSTNVWQLTQKLHCQIIKHQFCSRIQRFKSNN